MNQTTSNTRMPKWFWAIASLGLAWNIFGVVQFLATARGTVGSLMSGGMTQAQADLYINLPMWMTVAFAAGVFGGVLGSVLLLLRKSSSAPVFGVSLIAYVVLYIGDITQGVFTAFGPPQVVILTIVVLIAAGLLWLARHYQKAGRLK
jgi:hypothetical protein